MNQNIKKQVKEIIEWLLIIVFAVVAAMLINKYVIIKAEVPTGSMEHTIEVDDCILGFKLAYMFDGPERGDIVIFPYQSSRSFDYFL